MPYEQVVKEVRLEASNPFAGLISNIFVTRRKLRPHIKKQDKKSIDGLKEFILKVHISSGINIPIREGSIEAIIQMNEKINRDYQSRSRFAG